MRGSKRTMLAVAVAFAVLMGCDDEPGSFGGDGGAEPALAIVADDLVDGRMRVPYEAQLAATGADGPVSWSLVSGELPDGLELDEDGTIWGEPVRSGSFEFSVYASDGTLDGEADLAIDVPSVALLSGFEPFGGYATNPSYDSLVPLHEELVAGFDVRVVELPVVWGVSWTLLAEEIELLAPTAVIATGMAGSYAMRFETTARNQMEGVDNDGVEAFGEPIVEGGAATLTGALPATEMATAMEAEEYNTSISGNAGTYLCNYVFYRLMDHFVAEPADSSLIAAGFIHVPPAPYEGPFEVEDVTLAHRAGLAALATWIEDRAPLAPPPVQTLAAPVYGIETGP
jgi:pyroglutamyl-peptidase